MDCKKILLLILLLSLISCYHSNVHYVYSPDKKQCITFLDIDDSRYIFDGDKNTVPETNYVKLDISNRAELGEEIVACWANAEYEWKIIIHEGKVLENKLDTSRFIFSNNLPIDSKLGIPKYEIDGCFHFGTYYYSVVPENAAIIVGDKN